MKQATNLSPVEKMEEGTYNLLTMVSVAGVVSSLLSLAHLVIFHQMFSYMFLGSAIVFGIGAVVFPWLKSRRFGDRDLSLAERIVRIEEAMGVAA